MRIPKRYGFSRIDTCPFCSRQGIVKNAQDVPVCTGHKNAVLEEMKCACGRSLEMRSGKWGVFFSCLNCGNFNLRKVLEINDGVMRKETNIATEKETNIATEKKTGITTDATNVRQTTSTTNTTNAPRKSAVREITIRSDDPEYF